MTAENSSAGGSAGAAPGSFNEAAADDRGKLAGCGVGETGRSRLQ